MYMLSVLLMRPLLMQLTDAHPCVMAILLVLRGAMLCAAILRGAEPTLENLEHAGWPANIHVVGEFLYAVPYHTHSKHQCSACLSMSFSVPRMIPAC